MIINAIPYNANLTEYSESEVAAALADARTVAQEYDAAFAELSEAAYWNPMQANPTERQKTLYALVCDLALNRPVVETSGRGREWFPVKKWQTQIHKAQSQIKQMRKALA